jgi:hypothetical protein
MYCSMIGSAVYDEQDSTAPPSCLCIGNFKLINISSMLADF